jgi:DNA-binding YbaB/EbfC family protein
MKNLGNLMKQASQMQAKMGEMQAKLAESEVDGVAGAGLVQVTITGKYDLRKISIDRSLANPEEVSVLEDLIIAAFSDAKTKAEALMQEEMEKITGGMGLPAGLKLPF